MVTGVSGIVISTVKMQHVVMDSILTLVGSTVSTQRRQYKLLQEEGSESTPMTQARAEKLEAIGFKWSTKDPRHVPWTKRYQELVDFRVRLSREIFVEKCRYVRLIKSSGFSFLSFFFLYYFSQEKYGHSQVPIGWEVCAIEV